MRRSALKTRHSAFSRDGAARRAERMKPAGHIRQVALGRSRRDVEELCPDTTILDGLAVLGEDASEAQATALEWLRGMQ